VVSNRRFDLARALEQVRSHGSQPVVILDARVLIEGREQLETFVRSVYHRHGDRAVQGDHWVVGELHQQAVERDDLWPIRVFGAGGFVVDGGDGGLQKVG